MRTARIPIYGFDPCYGVVCQGEVFVLVSFSHLFHSFESVGCILDRLLWQSAGTKGLA